jgi:hypothetical protein
MSGLATAVAAYGFPSRCTLPASPLPDDDFADLLASCEEHGILGLFGEALRDDVLTSTEGQRAAAEAALRAAFARDIQGEQALLVALDVLSVNAIPSRVLGGADLAHTAYLRPELRVLGAIEVLVPSGRQTAAAEAVRRVVDPDRVAIRATAGSVAEAGDLFAPPYRFPLAGYELAALPMPQRLLRAAHAIDTDGIDAAAGAARLVRLRDVAQLVLREQPNLIDVLLMARDWVCEPVLARAVAFAWQELELDPDPPIVRWANGERGAG